MGRCNVTSHIGLGTVVFAPVRALAVARGCVFENSFCLGAHARLLRHVAVKHAAQHLQQGVLQEGAGQQGDAAGVVRE